jgi:membrane fusion protein, multidrug efflux system
VNTRIIAALVALVGAAACKSESPETAAAAQAGSAARGSGAGGAGGSGRRGGSGGGGRAAPSISLASSDVAPVSRETIESGIPITGDLHPIQTIGVRARIEGDLVEVRVREGQHVVAGELLARFEASEQETMQRSAEADVASAATDLSTAQWNLDQSAELFKAGAIAERDLKVAQQGVEAAKAKQAAAEARLRSASNSARDTRVLAPSSGIIEKRLVETGERVSRGAQLFSLVKNDVLELAASVPARQATAVRVGQTVHFAADGHDFDGKVARVSPTIDPITRAITVYIQIPNSDAGLKGGTFASGRVVERMLVNVVTVPTQAMRQSPENGRAYVYRIVNRSVEVAPIQTGVIDERTGRAEVLSGVNEGDRVIVGNVGVLGRGMQVTVLNGDDQGGRSGGRSSGSTESPRGRGRSGGGK